MDNSSVLPLVCTSCYASTTGDVSARGLLTLALVADIALTVIITLCMASRDAALGVVLVGASIAAVLAVRRYVMSWHYCSTCGSGELVPAISPRAELIAWELEKLQSARPRKPQQPPSPMRTASPGPDRGPDVLATVPAPVEPAAQVLSKLPSSPAPAPAPERPTRTLTIDQEKFLADKVAKEDAERFKGTP